MLVLKQLKVGHMANFTYIIWDSETKKAAVIDPSWDLERVIEVIKSNNLLLEYIINTHTHFDHILGNEQLKAIFPSAKIVMHKNAPLIKDIEVEDNSIIELGYVKIIVIHTPGHSKDSICLLAENMLFTGDTLFVGTCGRVDLEGGSASELYDSLKRLSMLDDNITIYPGHDYGDERYSTIGREKASNPVLRPMSKEEFIKLMNGF